MRKSSGCEEGQVKRTTKVLGRGVLEGAKAKDIDKAGREIMLSNTSELKMSACSCLVG